MSSVTDQREPAEVVFDVRHPNHGEKVLKYKDIQRQQENRKVLQSPVFLLSRRCC